MYVWDDLVAYRRARNSFSGKVYGILLFWLILAFLQWMVVSLVEDARRIFREYFYICLIAFGLAVFIFAAFIFADALRYMQALNAVISLIIVELQIIATFMLVVFSWWADVLVFFLIAVVLVFLFLLIGIFLPRRVDLTLDIAVLFIIAFIFLIIAVFSLAILMSLWLPKWLFYLVVELAVTLTVLLFVIYHAQTIHGNRFAEMRLNDFFLGSLILFHDFLIIFWLTFYWQIRYRPVTADNWVASSKPFISDQDWPTTPVPKAWKQWSGDDLTQPSWDEGKGAGEEYTYEPDNANNLKEFKHKNKAQQNPNIDSRSQIPNRKKQKKKKKIKARPTTMDWSVFPAFTESSHYAEQQIREPVPSEGEARHPGVLYKVKPIDGREFPEMEQPDLNKDKPVGFDSVYGEAKGKPKVVFGNPPIGFPLADRLEALDPDNNEWEVVGEEEQVNKFGHFVDEAEQLEKMRQENKTTFKRPQFLGDEMQGLNGDMQIPEWEVLTQEELRNLSDTHVPSGREEDIAEPLTTRPFYDPTDQPEFLKLVMNDTTVNPLAEPLTPSMFDEDYDILSSQPEYLELELNDTTVDKMRF